MLFQRTLFAVAGAAMLTLSALLPAAPAAQAAANLPEPAGNQSSTAQGRRLTEASAGTRRNCLRVMATGGITPAKAKVKTLRQPFSSFRNARAAPLNAFLRRWITPIGRNNPGA